VSAPRITVDLSSGVAPWRQIHDQITRAIEAGILPGGARLPSVRQLARDLQLAAGTVARSYRELEVAGWVHTARARGTIVADDPPRVVRTDEELLAAAREYVARAGVLGADRDAAVRAVLAALDAS
jgi:DNA-binding transcriptional regulator YhcF (GntR family)